jgi:hypothetical protein
MNLMSKNHPDGKQYSLAGIRRRNSLLLIAGILAAAAVMFAVYTVRMSGMDNPKLEILVGSRRYGVYDLDRDQIITINHTNVCEIRDGKVSMIRADCPDQICVKSAPIDRHGGTIVCMPNKVILRITDADGGEDTPDAVAG